jgi:altronate dehydratase
MPSLSFEGETHDEIVRKVRRWLASLDHRDEPLTTVEAVERASELTKDALTVIAQAAPGPIRSSEIVKALTRMGYEATDGTKHAVISGLDTLADAEDGVVKKVSEARRAAVYEMNSAVAKQVLRALKG